ncbi:hypothetical protein CVT25_004518 [Psilocybe cyanescens]|uniref:Uncharacterized protein n=1 Tax=Psilocybe cyanescens TaxID=93625 RepID=A0A409XRX8_PSICY|nr:hypothetical protein CVT25_004518 [Psilocybe cyanescens]
MAECIAPLSNESLKLHEHQKDSSAIRAFPNTKPLKQEPTSTIDPHGPKYFDNSVAADYAFAETASLMRILNLKNKQAAAEMFLFIAGAIVVTYAGAHSLCSRPTKY